MGYEYRTFSPRRLLVGGFSEIDRILKHQQTDANPPSNRRVIWIVIICGMTYGAVMGSYAMTSGHRSAIEQLPQMFYSATKVPLLFFVTVLVSLPSFFVINSLLGLRDDFREAVHAVVATQASTTIVLFSLAPLTMFVYVCLPFERSSYPSAVMFNAFAFGLSSISAQYLMRRYYVPLVKKNRRHQVMMRVWLLTYAFVGIQCAYILRPFIGDPNLEATWFREESFKNAYVSVFRIFVSAFFS